MSEADTRECWDCGTEHDRDALGYREEPGTAKAACPSCGLHYQSSRAKLDPAFERVVRTPEDHPTHELPAEEVRRRIPATTLIQDDEIQSEVERLTANAPAYFWQVPASTSGYHHPTCREVHGLWVHTLMVVTATHRLLDTYEDQGRLPTGGRDMAYAAAILHDQRKLGPHGTTEDGAASDHDRQMAEVVDCSDLPTEVADAVDAHMGPWYDGPEPDNGLQNLVHNADMMASTANATLSVPGPIPDELDDKPLSEADL